jgi:RND family efflux transporter MFP subunit
MQQLLFRIKKVFSGLGVSLQRFWHWYRLRPFWQQVIGAIIAIALIVAIIVFARSGSTTTTPDSVPSVSTQSLSTLSLGGGTSDIIGTVRSESQADILAQAGGTVTSVHTSLGASVPAGFVIAELQNASERAAVLQAQGGYDAALAGRASVSPTNIAEQARNTYRASFSSLDTILTTEVDTFYGVSTPLGPQLLINGKPISADELRSERAAITDQMTALQTKLSTVDSRDPLALLNEIQSEAQTISDFIERLALSANDKDSRATPAQFTALAAARSGVAGVLSAVAAAKDTYQHGNVSSTASVDASITSALGGLRAAQANLEKTIIRAPISGTINFLPIHVGDYVTQLMHVATVAQNGALEIVAYTSADSRNDLVVGGKVTVEGSFPGVITSVSPALDPVTKQIEVHIAVTGKNDLENGQSVRVSLPTANAKPAVVSTTATSTAALMLPLAAVKLEADRRIVFTVGTDNRLVAHPVEIGEVRGDKITVTTTLPSDLVIVIDARGLAEGEEVKVAPQS